jgi:hypothetical protein
MNYFVINDNYRITIMMKLRNFKEVVFHMQKKCNPKNEQSLVFIKLCNLIVTFFSEYVALWCQQNGGPAEFSEKEVNDAVTEQVSYARKKMKGRTTKS